MTDSIELSFVRNRSQRIELCIVQYKSGVAGKEHFSVRGKTSGAYTKAGTFQWTSAVRAACVLLLKTLLHGTHDDGSRPCLSGERASLASSLDYAVTKGPAWIVDMFGTDGFGSLRAKRLFRITNPNRKRRGPVTIALNTILLPAHAIKIMLDGVSISDPRTLSYMIRCLSAHEIVPDIDSYLMVTP